MFLNFFAYFTVKHLCWVWPEDLQLYLKETPTQVFTCKICKIVKNILLTAALLSKCMLYKVNKEMEKTGVQIKLS